MRWLYLFIGSAQTSTLRFDLFNASVWFVRWAARSHIRFLQYGFPAIPFPNQISLHRFHALVGQFQIFIKIPGIVRVTFQDNL